MNTNSTLNGFSHWGAPFMHNAAPNVLADYKSNTSMCDCSFANEHCCGAGKSCSNCMFDKKQIFFSDY